MNKINIRQNNKKLLLLSFLIAFIPRVLIAAKMIPMRTFSDELATLSSAAALAGNNWSDVVSQAGYYGFGFYWLFFIVFRLTDNPILIYRIILIACGILQALIAPICFYLLHNIFYIKNYKVKILFSTVCSFMVVTRITITYNEHILILISWLLTLILCLLWEDTRLQQKKNKLWHTTILSMLLLYSLTIHTRSLTYFIAIGIAIAGYWIISKKLLVSKVFFPLICFGYFCSKILINWVQHKIWLIEDGEKLGNASVTISENINIFEANTWKAIFNTIFGQITTITVFSGGLFLLLTLVIVYFTFQHLRGKTENDKNIELVIFLAWIFLMCIGATILTQSLSWLGGVVGGLNVEIVNKNFYAYKAFTYVRYIGPYIGPVIMCGLVLCYNNFELIKKVKNIFLISYVSLQAYWYFMIMPYIKNNAPAQEVFIAFSMMKNGDETTQNIYLAGLFILSIFIVLYLWSNNLTQFYLVLAILSILLIHEYGYTAINYDRANAQNNFKEIDKSYEMIRKIEPVLKEKELIDIYVFDKTERTDHQTYFLLQFYLNRYHIIPRIPDDSIENVILLSNKPLEDYEKNNDYLMIQLDDNEYVYTKGKILAEIMKQYK